MTWSSVFDMIVRFFFRRQVVVGVQPSVCELTDYTHTCGYQLQKYYDVSLGQKTLSSGEINVMCSGKRFWRRRPTEGRNRRGKSAVVWKWKWLQCCSCETSEMPREVGTPESIHTVFPVSTDPNVTRDVDSPSPTVLNILIITGLIRHANNG